MTHDYASCGWLLRSEIPLPELAPWDGVRCEPDVFLRCSVGDEGGDILSDLPSLLTRSCQDGGWSTRVPSSGAVAVRQGRYVELAATAQSRVADLATFVLGPVIAHLGCQRELLVMRASVVGHNGSATLLLGVPGIGKSATACLLLSRGYQLISDAVAVLEDSPDTGLVRALATAPGVRLWRSAIDALAIQPRPPTPVREQVEKYLFRPQSLQFDPMCRMPVRNVVFLVRRPLGGSGLIRSPHPPSLLPRLQRHLYFRGLPQITAVKDHSTRILRKLLGGVSAHIMTTSGPLYDADLLCQVIA